MGKFINDPLSEFVPQGDLARQLLTLFWLHKPLRAKYSQSSTLEEIGKWLDDRGELMNAKLLERIETDPKVS